MTGSIITREAAAVLSSKFETQFDDDALRRGFRLYAEGAVRHAWQDGFSIVHGIVKDSRDEKLQLDLDFFEASECACRERRCAHMAAVFFAVYAEHDRPERWLDDVLALRRKPSRAEAAGAGEGSGAERPGALPPAQSAQSAQSASAAVSTAGSDAEAPEGWPDALDRHLEALQRRHNDLFHIDIFYITTYKKLLSFADGWSEPAKALFRLYVPLFLLVRMDRYFAAHRDAYPVSYYQRVTGDLYVRFTDLLRDAAMRIDAQALQGPYRRYGDAAARLLRSGWNGDPNGPFDWPEIGRFLWAHLLADPAWLEEECRIAEERLADEDAPVAARARLLSVSAHLHWLSGRDEQAMERLREPGLAPMPVIATYIETLYKSASWERLSRWLQFSLPYLRRASADQFQRIIGYWREYAMTQGEEGPFVEALASLLPRSYLPFTDYLLSAGRYREWTDFHLLNGIPPGRIDRSQLERVRNRMSACFCRCIIMPLNARWPCAAALPTGKRSN